MHSAIGSIGMGACIILKEEKGAIILLVAVIIGIVSILYSSIYIFLGVENKLSQSAIQRTKAYYVAESGLERGAALVKGQTDFEKNFPFILTNPFKDESGYNQQHEVEVTLTEVNTGVYEIRSVGTYGKTKKIMEAEVNKSDTTFSIQSWKEVNN